MSNLLSFFFGGGGEGVFRLRWLQVEGSVPADLRVLQRRFSPSRLVCAGLLWSGWWPCLHAQAWPGLMSQHLFAPSVINCLRPCWVTLRLADFFFFFFSSPSNFALIDSICFHLLRIDLFVPLRLVNRRTYNSSQNFVRKIQKKKKALLIC